MGRLLASALRRLLFRVLLLGLRVGTLLLRLLAALILLCIGLALLILLLLVRLLLVGTALIGRFLLIGGLLLISWLLLLVLAGLPLLCCPPLGVRLLVLLRAALRTFRAGRAVGGLAARLALRRLLRLREDRGGRYPQA